MKLQLFNGGVNTRVAPELIPANEAIVCSNVDLTSGHLVAAKDLGPTAITALRAPYYWQTGKSWWADGDIKDYLPYQGALYWTSSGALQKHHNGITKDAGLAKPLSAPITKAVTSLPAPKFEVYERQFDVVPSIVEAVGDFPTASYTWHVLVYDDSGLVYTDNVTVSVTGGAILSTNGTIPPHMTIQFARDYSGGTYIVSPTDDVLDISGNPIADFTLSEEIPEEGTRVVLTAAIHTADHEGDLAPSVRHTLGEGNIWLELQVTPSENTFGIGRTTQTYIDRQEVPSKDLATIPELGPYWKDTGLTGVLQYVYTYYDVSDGTESEPSAISSELPIVNGFASYTVVASESPNVSHIKVYRIGANQLNFIEVAEHPNITATYDDELLDKDVVGGILNSVLHGIAPVGLRYMTESHGVFFAALGARLHFTDGSGNPSYWPETYYIDIHDDITGLAVTSSGLIVFTRHHTYLISGSSATTFVRHVISNDQGCINHKTIALKAGSALYLSSDGICTIHGNDVKVVSKTKLGEVLFDPINAVLYNEVYYCQLSDGRILTFDLRYNLAVHFYDFGTTWLTTAEDVLYADKVETFEMFAGLQATYEYSTGNLTEGEHTNLKRYDEIYFVVTGTHTAKVYVDESLVSTFNLVGQAKPLRVSIPQEYQRGSSIRFELSGIGTVKEIEYKAGGRTNGK